MLGAGPEREGSRRSNAVFRWRRPAVEVELAIEIRVVEVELAIEIRVVEVDRRRQSRIVPPATSKG
jgi:hypothetical protein